MKPHLSCVGMCLVANTLSEVGRSASSKPRLITQQKPTCQAPNYSTLPIHPRSTQPARLGRWQGSVLPIVPARGPSTDSQLNLLLSVSAVLLPQKSWSSSVIPVPTQGCWHGQLALCLPVLTSLNLMPPCYFPRMHLLSNPVTCSDHLLFFCLEAHASLSF